MQPTYISTHPACVFMRFLLKIQWGKLDLFLASFHKALSAPVAEVLPFVQRHSCRKCLIPALKEGATLYLLTSLCPSILATCFYRNDFPIKRHQGKACVGLWWRIKRIKNYYSPSLEGGNLVAPLLPLEESRSVPLIPDLFARWKA